MITTTTALEPGRRLSVAVSRTQKTAAARMERMITLLNVGATGAPAGSFLAAPAGAGPSASLASWRGFLTGGGPAVGRRRRFLAIATYLLP